MKSIIGIVVGLIWFLLAFRAFSFSSGGWSTGHPDLGFWWAVIGTLLAIAALGAVIGGLIHGRAERT
jgi:hypothetical protein